MKFQYILIALFVALFTVVPGFENQAQAQRRNKKEKENPELNDFKVKERKAAFMEGNKQKILENWDEAEANYRKALSIDPNHDASMYELARLYQRQGRMDDAILLAQQAVSIDGRNAWYYLLLADLYKNTRQFDKVIEVFEKLVEIFPEKIDYRYDLALTYIISGELKNAIEVYDEMEELVGVNEDLSLKKRNLWNNLNKPDKAILEIEKLVKTYPFNSRYLQILAESYVGVGQYDKALETYNKVVEIDPKDPYIHISLSDLYRQKGEDEKAYEELKLGFGNPDLNLDTKIQILITYYSFDQMFNEKKDQALELSEILVKTHPGDPRSMSLYGDLLYRSGRLEESLDIINQVLKIDGSNYSVWEQKLFIENELSRNEELAISSKNVNELFPMQPLPYLFNGFANYKLKRYEEARKSLEAGSQLVVGNDRLLAQFYSTLGDIYNQLGDHEKSDGSYDKALKINPDDPYVLNNYSYYLSLRNTNLERARELASRAIEIDSSSASFMDTYGWVLYKLGEYNEAEIWVKKSIDQDEEVSAVVLEHYGDILYKLGRTDEAIIYWEKARDSGGEASEFLENKIRDKKLYE